MAFTSLNLSDFRNFKNTQMDFNSSQIFFIGDNGQGKTNIIEALYLLCYGSSFRVRFDNLMINNDSNTALIKGDFLDHNELNKKISIQLSRSKAKEIVVDDKRVSDRKELIHNIPCVVFSHNDMQIIIGAPYLQRRFFNQTLSIYDIVFIDLLRKYKKILSYRNRILKERKFDLLDVYNIKLAQYGLEIQKKRENTVASFNPIFSDLFQRITGFKEQLVIHYEPSWKECSDENNVLDILKRRQEKDVIWKNTTSGPHRDRFFFYLGKNDFLKIASTGQTRLISIILKIAQAQFYTEVTQKKPLLLLDDVLLEIDKKKRELLIRLLPAYDQAFFTFLPDEDFASYEKSGTLKYLIKNGVIQAWNEPEIY
ncbi:MAG: DNA replication/repair protein RecF [Spirochaetales bacterium]|nr:DNA replication/repair protein RecF [Spirochaetales bacterium]